MKKSLSFQLALACLLMFVPASYSMNTRNTSTVIARMSGKQCRYLAIGASYANVKFRRTRGDRIVVRTSNPENWQRGDLSNDKSSLSITWKRAFNAHNGITFYMENGGQKGIAYGGRLHPISTDDYELIAKSTGALSIQNNSVFEGEKRLLSFNGAGEMIAPSMPGNLEIDMPDSFTANIMFSAMEGCNVDFGDFPKCASFKGMFLRSSMSAEKLTITEFLVVNAVSSTVHINNVNTRSLVLFDNYSRDASRFWVDSGSAQKGDLSGREQNFKLTGDFSTLNRSWVAPPLIIRRMPNRQ